MPGIFFIFHGNQARRILTVPDFAAKKFTTPKSRPTIQRRAWQPKEIPLGDGRIPVLDDEMESREAQPLSATKKHLGNAAYESKLSSHINSAKVRRFQ